MAKTPTFVIGVGGVGCDVVSALRKRQETIKSEGEHLSLLAVDSDREKLRNFTDITTVNLESDSGIVGEGVARYPFLTDDLTIPVDGAGQLRHVGRYKLDNPVSPSFQQHERTFSQLLENFVSEQQTSLSSRPSSYTFVLVFSLSGGTGSGTFPLVTAMLNRITAQLEDGVLDQVDTRIVGFGLTPSLDFDPAYTVPPAEPISYPNTYAAFRNLSTLLAAGDDQAVRIPVYSWTGTVGGRSDGGLETPGRVFSITDQPFDAFWLVSRESAGRSRAGTPRNARDIARVLGNAIHAMPVYASSESELWSRTSPVSPLGTIGYATVAVPHQAVRDYCELRQERREVRARVEEFIEPKLSELRSKRRELQSILRTRAEGRSDSDWMNRIYAELSDEPETQENLVTGTDHAEIETALDAIADQSGPRAHLLSALSLSQTLTTGEPGAGIRTEIRETIGEVREAYNFELIPEHATVAKSTDEKLRLLEAELQSRKETYQQHLADADTEIRDVLPPTNELFTSKRERLEEELERLDRHLERISSARRKHDSLDAVLSVSESHVREARRAVRSRIDELEREESHFMREDERCQRTLEKLDRDSSSVRESLTDPPDDGRQITLPLDWEALSDLTVETVESELTSIHAYHEHGLLKWDRGGVEEALLECYKQSRNWSEAVARHGELIADETTHEETVVLCHPDNERVTQGIRGSLTEPDAVHFSSDTTLGSIENPYRIEIVSVSQGGTPETLVAYRRLERMKDDGVLDAMAGGYRDCRRALAYPEWYGSEIGEAFE